jgi:hypothetical protein
MQPPRFIQQVNSSGARKVLRKPASGSTLPLFACAGHTFKTSFFKPASPTELLQIRETKARAHESTARRSLHAGMVPNGVRWKNLLRRLLQSPAGIRS